MAEEGGLLGVTGRELSLVAFLTGIDPDLVGIADFLGLGLGLGLGLVFVFAFVFVDGVVGLAGVVAVVVWVGVVVVGIGAEAETEAGGELGDGTEAVVSTVSAVVAADEASTMGVAI